jgi:hypothetical protein
VPGFGLIAGKPQQNEKIERFESFAKPYLLSET